MPGVFTDNHALQLVILLGRYERLSGFVGMGLEEVRALTVADLLDDLVVTMSRDEQETLLSEARKAGLEPDANPFFTLLPWNGT